MKLFIYRGNRVRKFYRNIKAIVFSFMLLPFLIFGGCLLYLHWNEWMTKPIFWSVTSGIILVILLVILFILEQIVFKKSQFFSKLDNLRLLSNFLIENGFFIEKKGVENRKRIILPKVYLKRDTYGLDVSFILQGNKYQNRFLNLAKDLEIMFEGDFIEKTFDTGFVTYTLAFGRIEGRMNVLEIGFVNKKGIQLMSNIYWNFEEQPHLLLSGGTGGGKTVFLMSLIFVLAKIGFVDICDPKKSDFVGLKDIPVFHHRVFFEKEDMIQCLKDNVAFMDERYQVMTSHPDFVPGKRYSEYGLRPKFVVFDEWAAFMASIDSDYKSISLVTELLTQLILKGRQAGVFVILGMQRADGEFIKTALRDNFMKRLTIGHLEDTGYNMMFGDANRDKEFKKIDKINGKKVHGRGYIANGGEIAQEFFSPYVPFDKGFSFVEEFQKLPVLEFEGKEFEVFNDSSAIVNENKVEKGFIYPDFEEEEEMGEKIYLDELAASLGKTIRQVRDVIALIEKGNYRSFEKKEGKYVLSKQDTFLLKTLFLEKEETNETWKVIIKKHFE